MGVPQPALQYAAVAAAAMAFFWLHREAQGAGAPVAEPAERGAQDSPI
jgi:hypothetical protein